MFVRHGESEGNVAFNRSVAGDHSLYTGPFLDRHSSQWRLTDRGREQAHRAGEWMRENIDTDFDGYYSSEYLRALETAAHLELPSARWRPEVMLRERDWGEYDLASQERRAASYVNYEKRRRRESLFWSPPGGESLAQASDVPPSPISRREHQLVKRIPMPSSRTNRPSTARIQLVSLSARLQVMQRIDSMLLFLNRRCVTSAPPPHHRLAFRCVSAASHRSPPVRPIALHIPSDRIPPQPHPTLLPHRRFGGQRVVATCHGELMWAFRLRFEQLTGWQYREMQARTTHAHPARASRTLNDFKVHTSPTLLDLLSHAAPLDNLPPS